MKALSLSKSAPRISRCGDGPGDGAPLCVGATARELLSAVVQTQGETPRRRKGDQAVSPAGDAVRACPGPPKAAEGDQATAARDVSHARSGGASGRDP